MREGAAQRFARFLLSRRRAALAATLVIGAACAWRAGTLRVDADVLNMLDRDDPVRRDYERLADRSILAGALFVVLPPMERDAREETLAALRGLPEVASAAHVPTDALRETVLAVRQGGSPVDATASAALMAAVERTLAPRGVRGQFTGAPAIVVETRWAVQRDLQRAAAVTAVLVMLFFLFFYRAGWLALFSLAPIAVGTAVGLALSSLFTDHLNLLAASLPSLFIGLGIDYCIHMVQSASVQARAGAARTEAVVAAWAAVLRPLTVGALTTAAGFFALNAARLRGLGRMGSIAAVTILSVYLACLVMMPVILSFCPEAWLTRSCHMSRRMRRLADLARRRAAALLFVGGAVSVAAATGVALLRLESDNTRLEDQHLPSRVLQERLASEARLSTSPIVLTTPSYGAAVRFAAALRPRVMRADAYPDMSGGMVVVHLPGNPYSAPTYAAFLRSLEYAQARTGVAPEEMAGGPVVNDWLAERLRGDWPRLLGSASAAVLAVSALGARSLVGGLLALLPLACGLLWTGGAMGLVGYRLNIMGAAAAPLILGIGVDNGVHLLMATCRHGGRLADAFEDTGVAVVATTVTTVSAFGALCLSTTPALVAFGWQASAGLVCCLVSGLFLLPAVVRLTGWAREGPESDAHPRAGSDAPPPLESAQEDR